MIDDEQLLRQYRQERSETAFSELVARHIDLVYSAALRMVNGDSHLAQDVTQIVFTDLARKAWGLPRGVMLAGWLYRHTRYTGAKTVRTERRRQTREQTAMEMNAPDDNTEPKWELIAPHLDEGMSRLSAADRDAIVLRFLKQQDFHAVGAALGISEDAAQKRVSRALEKLRGFLTRRGVTLTATALASALGAEAVTAAPAGLAVSVTAASLAGGRHGWNRCRSRPDEIYGHDKTTNDPGRRHSGRRDCNAAGATASIVEANAR
jgi:RNA polymerase sigma factor (sigma-70 family)